MRTRTERRAEREAAELRQEITDRWRWTLGGTAAARTVTSGSGAPTTSVPTVTGVDLHPAGPLGTIELIVRLLAGQLPADLMAVAARIAEGMSCAAVRVQPLRPGYVVVQLLSVDPLRDLVALDPTGPPHPDGLLVGVLEHGGQLRSDPTGLPHLMVQGQTRSGKSTWLYALLAQLARYPRVRITGVDPSGITLRPFAPAGRTPGITLGLSDPEGAVVTLAGLVGDMDRRLAAMPEDRDVLAVTDDHPLTVVVLDEYPGLLRALDAVDTKTGKRARALVARLLAESHKVGYRVVIAAQRAEASIVGAAERAQCGGRLSFRVDSPESVRLLHPDGDAWAAEHAAAPAGIALASWPGAPTQRMRGPILGEYADYVRYVRHAA